MKHDEDEEIEYNKKFEELYISISKVLDGKFFKNGQTNEYYGLLGSILWQMSLKNYVIAGMGELEFKEFHNGMKDNFEYIYNEYHKGDRPIFSEGLKKAMDPFKDQNVNDCIHDPDFYKALLKYAGNSDEEADKIMADIDKKIGKG